MSYLSVSTWSLHRLLGPLRWTIWDDETQTHRTIEEDQPQLLTLLELPAEAAKRGFKSVEICHFHFPSIEPAYLTKLQQAFFLAGIALDTLLLDYGDLTAKDENRRKSDRSLIQSWIEIASLCGAKQIRVIAGEALPSDREARRISAMALLKLSEHAASLGVRLITENFKPLTSTGASCLALLREADHQIRIITDFGNYEGPSKYSDIALTVPYSVTIHAKANYDENGLPDEAEFRRCLQIVNDAGYDGSYVLIYDGPGDMWEGLGRIGSIVQSVVFNSGASRGIE